MRISDWSSTCALPIYPHSWRSKAKVIYRCTPQWFVPMDKVMTHISPKTPSDRRWENEGGALDPPKEDLCDAPTLRQAAMQAIDLTRFVPEKGRNRIGSMVKDRPDWVLSDRKSTRLNSSHYCATSMTSSA